MADMCEKLYLNLTLEEPSSTVTKFANSVDPVEMADSGSTVFDF